MNPSIENRLIYRHASLNAYHPSLVCVSEHEWVITHDLGRDSHSLDYHTQAIRTQNGGASWEVMGPLLREDPLSSSTHTIRVRRMKDGRLVGFGKYEDRRNHRERRCHETTFGQVPMRLFWIDSKDCGENWSDPHWIEPPLTGPTWELCHAVVELPDGSWGAPARLGGIGKAGCLMVNSHLFLSVRTRGIPGRSLSGPSMGGGAA